MPGGHQGRPMRMGLTSDFAFSARLGAKQGAHSSTRSLCLLRKMRSLSAASGTGTPQARSLGADLSHPGISSRKPCSHATYAPQPGAGRLRKSLTAISLLDQEEAPCPTTANVWASQTLAGSPLRALRDSRLRRQARDDHRSCSSVPSTKHVSERGGARRRRTSLLRGDVHRATPVTLHPAVRSRTRLMRDCVVTIEERGQVWIGRYWVRDGILIVTAAYGERRAVATRNVTKLHSQAETLLGELARQYLPS